MFLTKTFIFCFWVLISLHFGTRITIALYTSSTAPIRHTDTTMGSQKTPNALKLDLTTHVAGMNSVMVAPFRTFTYSWFWLLREEQFI